MIIFQEPDSAIKKALGAAASRSIVEWSLPQKTEEAVGVKGQNLSGPKHGASLSDERYFDSLLCSMYHHEGKDFNTSSGNVEKFPSA
jgi:hypothetical protein